MNHQAGVIMQHANSDVVRMYKQPPRDVHTLIPGIHDHTMLGGKRDSADTIKWCI